MKKFLALTCMIACILGMTACGGEEKLTDYEQQKVNRAVSKATQQLIPCIQSILVNPETVDILREYTAEEVEYSVGNVFQLEVDGNAFISALDSFASTYEEIGGNGSIKDAVAHIDGDQIIVNVTLEGPSQDAKAEIVFTNDIFLKMEAASLNKVDTMGDSMAKAGLNTVLGMGTVFAVLILISLIISCFGIINKIQTRREKKAVKEPVQAVSAPVQTAVPEVSEDADDLELVAVIAAAVAASEGAVSTDGFVVRSIKRRRAY